MRYRLSWSVPDNQLILPYRKFGRNECPGSRRSKRECDGAFECSASPLVRTGTRADMRQAKCPDFDPVPAWNRYAGSQGILSRCRPSICCKCNKPRSCSELLTPNYRSSPSISALITYSRVVERSEGSKVAIRHISIVSTIQSPEVAIP